MVTRAGRFSISSVLVVAGLALASACDNSKEYVTPAQGTKQAPTFTVGNNIPTNVGKVDPAISTAGGMAHTTWFAELQLTVMASNAVTGVKSLDVTIGLPGLAPIHTLHMDGTPLANGDVPIHLRGVGTNGAGGPGTTPLNVKMTSPYLLKAKAVSFDGSPSEIELWYWPWADVSATFSASVTSIGIGQSTALNWTTKNAQYATIQPGNIGLTSASGSLAVAPAVTTPYELKVSNPFSSILLVAPVFVATSGPLTVTYSGAAMSTMPGGLPLAPTFHFTGTYKGSPTAPGTGDTSFDKFIEKHFEVQMPWIHTETFTNLRPGPWEVTVDAPTQAVVTCPAAVVGVITLSSKPGTTKCQ